MVILFTLVDSYIINGDGSQSTAVQLTSPNNLDTYTRNARSAIVGGQLYLFGGNRGDENTQLHRKIARLDGCAIVELSVQLTRDFIAGHEALAAEDGSNAIICFGQISSISDCDVFDGSTAVSTFSSNFPHRYGGLGHFNGKPTTVGSAETDGFRKVESLENTGWTTLADFSENIYGHDNVGLPNGDMILIGGKDNDDDSYSDAVWKLNGATGWTQIGTLQQAMAFGTAIIEDNCIYSFGGLSVDGGSQNPIQRIDLAQDNTIEQTELLGSTAGDFAFPILLFTDFDTCVAN